MIPVAASPPFVAEARGIDVSGDTPIARRGFRPPPRESGKRLRTNDQIRLSPIRLIDEEDNQLGLVDVDEAKAKARAAGLDLVEVSPGAKPPVCKIMDYGKWKYAQQKKEQKAKSHAKKSELKGMRLRPNIDDHDLDLKVKKAREFLEDGDKVQFVMLFRGRQMAHKDLARDTMLGVFAKLEDCSKIEQSPKMAGRRMTMMLVPDRKKAGDDKKKPEASGEAPKPSAPRPAPPAAARKPEPEPEPQAASQG